jgi:parallel beta-helix repeat protein
MSRKVVYSVVLVVVIMGVLGVAFDVQMVEAPYLVIYIKADGSIDPSTPNIESLNNVTYTFKADMNASIVVQRSNITIDGKGYTLGMDYLESTIGFNLTSVSNVTIKNMEIRGFEYGIYLYVSSNNTISGNNITNNERGINLNSSSNNNTLTGNKS